MANKYKMAKKDVTPIDEHQVYLPAHKKHQALAEIQISYKPKNHNRISISDTTDTFPQFLKVWDLKLINIQEQFAVMFLDRKNSIVGYRFLHTGSIDTCVIDVRIILSIALKCLASNIIIAHNHPSGSLKPSGNDIELTRKVSEACKSVSITLLDHFIINRFDYYSFRNHGIL